MERWTRLSWAGEVDSFSVEPLESVLRGACERETALLEVDLSRVTFMDCAGLGPLLAAQGRLLGRMRLFAPSPPVIRLLDLLGLRQVFEVVGPLGPTSGPDPRSAASDPGSDQQRGDEPAMSMPQALTDRATIEQAKGLLMGSKGCDAAEAWQLLRGLALANDVRIRVMAKLLIDDSSRRPWASRVLDPGGPVPTRGDDPDDVQAEFLRSGPPPVLPG